jgi:branched-chain amino acid transport system ATP-binding protein
VSSEAERGEASESTSGERRPASDTADDSLEPNVRETPASKATGDRTDTLLQTDDLVKQFGGFTATDSVDFSVDEGELRCLIGPNGAGKSTLLNLIVGTLRPTAGRVYYGGHDVTEMDPDKRVQRGISMKFQVPSVYGDLSVRENARLPIQQFADGDERRRRVDEAIAAAGLSGYEDVDASVLSHGQQQQLEIGMAASLEPDLLLLDEPVAGLSVDERDGIAERIRRLNREAGIAFVVIEHDTDFVGEIADKVTVLHQGDVFREGSIEAIEADPEVRRIYLGGER